MLQINLRNDVKYDLELNAPIFNHKIDGGVSTFSIIFFFYISYTLYNLKNKNFIYVKYFNLIYKLKIIF